MDPVQIQKLLEQKRIEMGQRMAPSNFQAPSIANDQQVAQMQKSKDQKILELYEHDKAVADRYANPQSESYMIDPYAREKARATMNQATAGEVLDMNSKISARQAQLQEDWQRQQQAQEYQLKMDQMQASMLQNQLENAMRMQESNKKADDGSEVLKQLFSGVTDFQNKAAVGKPIKEGMVKNKESLRKLQKSYPGSTVQYTKQKDGSFKYVVLPKGFKEMSAEEARYAQNPQELSKKLLAATIAERPNMAQEASLLLQSLLPQPDAFRDGVDEVASGVAGEPKTPENYKRLEEYRLNKNQQVISQPGWFGAKNQYMLNKQTGETTPIETGGFSLNPFSWLSGLFGGNKKQPPATQAPSYFQPD